MGVARQLLEPLVLGQEAVAGLLDGPARAAAPVFGLPGPAREAAFPVDSGPGLEHALFRDAGGVVRGGAGAARGRRRPLVRRGVVALARLPRAPGRVAAAGGAECAPAGRAGRRRAGLLDELGALDGALRLTPAPLSEAATAVLAGETFGAPATWASCAPAAR